jgi:predicted PurR-regulated permease PerM
VAAGTVIYGIVGALIAVPLVAFLNAFVRALREARQDTAADRGKAANA